MYESINSLTLENYFLKSHRNVQCFTMISGMLIPWSRLLNGQSTCTVHQRPLVRVPLEIWLFTTFYIWRQTYVIFSKLRVWGQIFIKRGNMAPGQRACDYQFNNTSCMIRTLAGMIRQKSWVWVPFETTLSKNLSHLCHSLWLPLVYWLLPPFFFTGRSFSRGKQKRKVL